MDNLNDLDDADDHRAYFDNDDDRCVSSEDDNEDPLLTQPPSLRYTTRDAERVPFLDSVCCVIDNVSAFFDTTTWSTPPLRHHQLSSQTMCPPGYVMNCD